MKLLGIYDGAGIYGSLFHYAFVVAFVGSAFMIFIYVWWKGMLNMDEGPKFQMLDEKEESEEKNGSKQ